MNQNLQEMSEKGTFKADLYQRLHVFSIEIPPPRARSEDIPELIDHFIQIERAKGSKVTRFTPRVLTLLKKHPWPGNVRELRNVISYVAAMAERPVVDVSDLPVHIHSPRLSEGASNDSFYTRVESYERSLLEHELDKVGGSVQKLAIALQMNCAHLYGKLKKYGLYS